MSAAGDYDQVVVQSIVLVSIPAAAMVLGGLYPLIISEEAPNKKFSFAMQHFAGEKLLACEAVTA